MTAATPAVERQIAGDMIRRALPLVPIAVVVVGAALGLDAALSVLFAIGLVLANFALSAALLAWAAGISLPLLMTVALAGYPVRLALITVAVLAVRHQAWVRWWPLGMALIVTHLGLLFWETKYVSATLAFPGLKPRE